MDCHKHRYARLFTGGMGSLPALAGLRALSRKGGQAAHGTPFHPTVNHPNYVAALAAACFLLNFSGCLLCGGPLAGLGGPQPGWGPPMMSPQPVPATPAPTQVATQSPLEVPQARFHPVPVRPVFLPGSYAAPRTLQRLPSRKMQQFQGPKLDEPPPFPESEEVGPPEAQVDGEAQPTQTSRLTPTPVARIIHGW